MGRPLKYPFDRMEIDDYFDAPLAGVTAKDGCDVTVARLRRAAAQYGARHGLTLIVYTVRAEGVARCERLA